MISSTVSISPISRSMLSPISFRKLTLSASLEWRNRRNRFISSFGGLGSSIAAERRRSNALATRLDLPFNHRFNEYQCWKQEHLPRFWMDGWMNEKIGSINVDWIRSKIRQVRKVMLHFMRLLRDLNNSLRYFPVDEFESAALLTGTYLVSCCSSLLSVISVLLLRSRPYSLFAFMVWVHIEEANVLYPSESFLWQGEHGGGGGNWCSFQSSFIFEFMSYTSGYLRKLNTTSSTVLLLSAATALSVYFLVCPDCSVPNPYFLPS